MGLGRKVTGARTGNGGRSLTKGTIRAPKRSGNRTGGAKLGTGFSAKRLTKGTIRSHNNYGR